MRTVAIILGDNDFGSTFVPLLETMKNVLKYRDRTPEQVETIIRQFAVPHYVAFQYSFSPSHYGGDATLTQEEHLASIADYFKRIRVLFDEEAEGDIATNDHDSGAWYLELQSGTVSFY